MITTNFHVLSGAPGTGKSSVIKEIESRGHSCQQEIARNVIKENMQNGVDIFPWNKMELFSDMVLATMKKEISLIPKDEPVFFDRCMVDLVGYLNYANQSVPERYIEEINRIPYSRQVYYFPLWEEIYITDAERKETLEEARLIDEGLRKAYTDLGFELIEVPYMSVKKRVAFIVSRCIDN